MQIEQEQPAALDGEPQIVGRQCFPSEEMKATPNYRQGLWIDEYFDRSPSHPDFYRVEPLIRLSDHRAHVAQLLAEIARVTKVEHGLRVALQTANEHTKLLIAERDTLKCQPVLQWSDQDGIWMDGTEQEMASARCEGFRTRALYQNPQPPIAMADVIRAYLSASRSPHLVGTLNWFAHLAEQLNTSQN